MRPPARPGANGDCRQPRLVRAGRGAEVVVADGSGVVRLAPELAERVRRLAKAQGISEEQVVADAVGIAWVRFACRERMKPEAW